MERDIGTEWIQKLNVANEDLKNQLVQPHPQLSSPEILQMLSSVVELIIKIYTAIKG
jgi:predicted lysophospholipase L1 biosynthesis ABC-type transport system permease subunit